MQAEILKAMIFAAVFLGIYLCEFLLLARFIISRLRHLPRRSARPAFRVAVICLHVVAAAGVLCTLYAVFIEPHWIEVVNVDVPTARLHHASLTVVQISDLHCDATPGNEEEVVRIVNDLHPDIIVFTGDAANTRAGLPRFRDTLSRLKAVIGKFAVRGNIDHEYTNHELFDSTNFYVMDGNYVICRKDGDSFRVIGVSVSRGGSISSILGPNPQNIFTIFLHHYPHFIDEVLPGQVDLSLCGHTHGGQIALPFYGAIITFSPDGKKYERGEYHTHGALLYVNRGIGTEKAPIRARFMARPEITVFHIHPAGQSN